MILALPSEGWNEKSYPLSVFTVLTLRGYTLFCAILDEIAFRRSEGANPDKEIVTGLRVGLATLGGKLVGLSSPYAKRGVLRDTFKRHFAGDSTRILVAQAPTLTMNPTPDCLKFARIFRGHSGKDPCKDPFQEMPIIFEPNDHPSRQS